MKTQTATKSIFETFIVNTGMLLTLALLIFSQACSSGESTEVAEEESEESTTEDSTSALTAAFPTSQAVTSPFDTISTEEIDASSSSAVSALVKKASGSGYMSTYAWTAASIEDILTASSSSSCTFDPELFLAQDDDATCFGPAVDYEAHPDALSSGDPNYNGELPPGDLGLFMEEEPVTGMACAAAQVNVRMEGLQNRATASLMSLASLVCVVNSTGATLPSNSTLDLTTDINAPGLTDMTFTTATITHSDASGTDEWSYEIDMEYTPGSDTHHIVINMTHLEGASSTEYQGRISYLVNDTMTGGNCPSSDITRNGSILYQMNSADDLDVEARGADFCGADVDGLDSGLVDASDKYSSTNTDGWGNNFSILTANHDPVTKDGDYAYSWQAGPQDDNSRVFNVHVANSGVNGYAFYGYGADIDGTDGNIDGFICNWTGPENDHTLQDFSQYQEVEYDAGTGKFNSVSAQIGYAFTNSCDYDGTGSLTYDSDLDGLVDTDPADSIANDLETLNDADTDGDFDEIEAAGFTAPSTPPNI